MNDHWRIELLGGLRAHCSDRVVARFRTQKTGALLGYLARQHSGCRLTEIAEHFGGMSGAALSMACRRLEEKRAAKRKLRKQVEELSARWREDSRPDAVLLGSKM